ncbi:MAG TPA: cytochrome d ubiquinol oxidase subunit II [Nitrospira sp.]|nr:cytochrome d ubiquinol oxidase subunit II [Nitrospira sp.]
METLWFSALTFVLAMYIVLDGYDLGVAMLFPVVATDESERRMVRATIGPVWTGNEVWLIAGSGLLFLSFPKAYAAGFSGFYLGFIMVLWLLMGRGLAFELRGHVEHPLWRRFWDTIFFVTSLSLAFLLGLFAGNVIRGVPLDADGYFFLPLWTDLRPGLNPGILDWFTLLAGLTMVVLLTLHGASYLAMKTVGRLQVRSRALASWALLPAVPLVLVFVVAIPFVRATFTANFHTHPAGYLWVVLGLLAFVSLALSHTRQRQVAAFASSSVLLAVFIAVIAWGTYPNLLVATTEPANSVTIHNASPGKDGLQAALWWLPFGLLVVVLYQIQIHRMFAAPVTPDSRSVSDH